MIGSHHVDVDIANVDLVHWQGTATGVEGVVGTGEQEIVTLLEQPRPGWNARALATAGADGVVHLEGTGQFAAPRREPAPGRRSLWVRKSPRAT